MREAVNVYVLQRPFHSTSYPAAQYGLRTYDSTEVTESVKSRFGTEYDKLHAGFMRKYGIKKLIGTGQLLYAPEVIKLVDYGYGATVGKRPLRRAIKVLQDEKRDIEKFGWKDVEGRKRVLQEEIQRMALVLIDEAVKRVDGVEKGDDGVEKGDDGSSGDFLSGKGLLERDKEKVGSDLAVKNTRKSKDV